MGEVDYIQKEKKQGMNYTIVSHDAVTAKVRPVLLKHGIVYYPVRCEHKHEGNRAECSMSVRFVNIDETTDFFDVPTFGYGIDTQDKGPGKAMSYAVKYALLKALGLETGDDPEIDSIDYQPPATKQKEPSRQDPAVRKAYTDLVNDMRKCTDADSLLFWWKDSECVDLRKKLPEGWQSSLRDEWTALGKELRAKQTDAFPGSGVTDQSGRELNNGEAG